MSNKRKHERLPSPHQVGDIVDVDFFNSKYLKSARVRAVTFTDGGVLYDIELPVGFDDRTVVISGVSGEFVVPPADLPSVAHRDGASRVGLDDLERMLEVAVEQEDYALCARLRDAIAEIGRKR